MLTARSLWGCAAFAGILGGAAETATTDRGWIGGAASEHGGNEARAAVRERTPAERERRQAAPKFEGEYGLYVGLVEGGLDVRWLTSERVRGVVRAWVDGEIVAESETSEGQEHMARLELDESRVILEFGVDEPGGLYRTEILMDDPPKADVDPDTPDSVYVFGDVHGQFDRIVELLEGAGLVDDAGHWSGGEATVALLGDLFDRGDDVTRLLWYLYRLEREAESAGGRVAVVLGNHEVMVMSGDLRYVSPKEDTIAVRHGLTYASLYHPSESVLGRWLASKPGLIRMDDLLMAHGGVSPTYRRYSLRRFQDSLSAFIAESLFLRWDDAEYLREFVANTDLDSAGIFRRYEFFFSSQSVLWYRDFVLSDTLGEHLDDVLDRFDSEIHVVAHTPVQTIQERYGGRLIAVDLLDAASEMLLLVRRERGGWDRFKVPMDGPPRPLGSIP